MKLESYLLDLGQVIFVHTSSDCIGEWCVIHRPMPGPWQSWPRYWDEARKMVERICDHGLAHPAAETYEIGRILAPNSLIHECDGCPCTPLADLDERDMEISVERPLPSGSDLRKEVYDLIADLAPWPGYASVVLETHDWLRLRRVLYAVLDLTKE